MRPLTGRCASLPDLDWTRGLYAYCDGSADNGLGTQQCSKQKGVCAGAK